MRLPPSPDPLLQGFTANIDANKNSVCFRQTRDNGESHGKAKHRDHHGHSRGGKTRTKNNMSQENSAPKCVAYCIIDVGVVS